MERKEAVDCLTEIITRSGWVPDAFSIIPCDSGNTSLGYKITIASTDKELKKVITIIAQKRNLAVQVEKNTVTIFEAEKKSNEPLNAT